MNNENNSAQTASEGELRRKKKRAAKTGKLLILVAVCAALAVGYAIISPLLSDKTEEEADTSITVSDYADSAVSAMSYTAEGGIPVNLKLGESSGQWLCADDIEFPITQKTVQSMASSVASVSADREITDPGELSQYGLDNPDLSVTVSYSDGSEKTYLLGNYNDYSQSYYMLVNGESRVLTYSGSMVSSFSKTLDDLISLETLPSADITFTSYSVTAPDGTEAAYDDEGLIALLPELTLTGYEKYKPTDDEKLAFGLDSSSAHTLLISYDEAKSLALDDSSGSDVSSTTVTTKESYTLTVGGYVPAEDGSDSTERYLIYNGGNIVYKADSSLLDTLISGVAPASDITAAEETVA